MATSSYDSPKPAPQPVGSVGTKNQSGVVPLPGLLNTKFEQRLDLLVADLKQLPTKNRVEAPIRFNAISNSYLLFRDIRFRSPLQTRFSTRRQCGNPNQ